MSIFKDCDIRGTYGVDLTEAVMEKIGLAVARVVDGRTICVGGDFRTHTPQLKDALIRALVRGGAQVLDVGQMSTPQLYFSKRYLGTYASAQVTASHNPPRYNGLKLMFGDLPVQPSDMKALEQAVQGPLPEREGGSCVTKDTTAAYEQMLRTAYRGSRSLKIVVDAGNGAMSEIAPRVMEQLGHQVVPLYCTYDGSFPNRDPNPAVKAHLKDLCKAVVESGADFGAAFDGDGDRVIFVDGEGVPLTAEEALVIYVNHMVQPGDSMVYDLKCSTILKKAIESRGGIPIMERSGHAFIRRHFMQAHSVLAGEVSGHYFFRELEGDDGLYGLVQMASIAANSGGSLRSLLQGVSYRAITPDIRIRATAEEIDRVFARMEDWAASGEAEVLRLDGIRLEFPDGSWLLLRRSITEPAFTMRLEAQNPEQLADLKQRTARRLQLPAERLA